MLKPTVRVPELVSWLCVLFTSNRHFQHKRCIKSAMSKPAKIFCYTIIGLIIVSPSFSQISKEDSLLVNQLNRQSFSLQRSNPDSSRLLANEALRISKKFFYKSGIARSYTNLGMIHFYRGNYDSTYYYWKLSLEKWQELANRSKEAILFTNLAMVAQELNKPVEAIGLAKQAIQLHSTMQDSAHLSSGYNNLGIMYKRLGDTQKALEYHYKSMKIRKATGDSVRLPSSYVNLGSAYNLIKNLDSSKFFLSSALNLLDKDDIRGRTIAQSKLAEMYYLSNSLDSALFYVDTAILGAEHLDANHILVELFLWKAKILGAQNRLDEALELISMSDNLALNKQVYREVSRTELLSEIYLKKKDYKQAANYIRASLKEKDSIYEANSVNRIAEVTAKSYYDLKEAELKYQRTLEQKRLEYVIENQTYTRSLLIMIILFILLIMGVIVRAYVLIKRKNKILNKQQNEIEKLTIRQKEIIEMRTAELLSTKDVISRYAFLNSHELRAPLARILGVIHLSDKQDLDQDTFIKSLKISAEELEVAVSKISDELNRL